MELKYNPKADNFNKSLDISDERADFISDMIFDYIKDNNHEKDAKALVFFTKALVFFTSKLNSINEIAYCSFTFRDIIAHISDEFAKHQTKICNGKI